MPYTDPDNNFIHMPGFEVNKADYLDAMNLSMFDADALIDSALAERYPVPFSQYSNPDPGPNLCPPIITTIASMLSRSIFLSGSYLADGLNGQPRVSMVLWDRAWMLLNKIIDGEMNVVGGSTLSPVLSKNLGVWARRRKGFSLKDFDLESPICPPLHQQMSKYANGLRVIADNGEVIYYTGCCN